MLAIRNVYNINLYFYCYHYYSLRYQQTLDNSPFPMRDQRAIIYFFLLYCTLTAFYLQILFLNPI